MALTHLLDTSIFSQPVKDRPLTGVLKRWSTLNEHCVCTAAVCLAELLQGLEERQSDKYWRRFRELLQDRYVIMPFDSSVAACFGRVSAELRKMGKPRPALDLLIAATAIHHGLTLATLNAKDFTGIPGLQVEDWSVPPH